MKSIGWRWVAALIAGLWLVNVDAAGAVGTKTCWGGDKASATLEAHVRKEEGVRVSTEMLNKIMIALDRVLMSKGKGDPAFQDNVDFVMGLQLDPQKMKLLIESSMLTTTAEFEDRWQALSRLFKYRKRDITNWIVVDYRDVDCRRELKLAGVGHSYGMLDDDIKLPAGFHTSRNFIDFDRFTITFREVADGVFRTVDMVQVTESTFPLPDGAVVPPGRSPFVADAPGTIQLVSP